MSMLLHRQYTRLDDRTVGTTIEIAISFLLLALAVLSMCTPVLGLLASCLLASCSVSEEIANDFDQFLKGVAV